MNARKPVLTILAGLAALFGFNPPADAATPRTAAASVCETGHRGQPAYDRKCLRSGTFKIAAMMWLSIPEGAKGRESDGAYNRRSVCKFAGRYGGTRTAVRELLTDVTYDSIRNWGQSLTWSADTAVIDCTSLGYKIVK